jgi:UDP-N-acetylmuramate: L-alanyl-gamma-D-glutamyl-meso-diaminopimelate ligase
MVVAGTHGKSTTTAALTHLLSEAGLEPGYLIGAQPLNFEFGASLGSGKPFVIEGDEYDTAFFDKRSKFLHYFPRTLVLGAVEFDHADIFADLDDVLLAFKRLLRIVPSSGSMIYDHDSKHARELAALAPCKTISVGRAEESDWRLLGDNRQLAFRSPDGTIHHTEFQPVGEHNRRNMLMAIAAACSYFGSVTNFAPAISSFRGIRRRLEQLYKSDSLVVYDDFAHHPTAIKACLTALRNRYPGHRLIAALEPRSNTMVRNIFQEELPAALAIANEVFVGDIHRLEKIPVTERLDYDVISRELQQAGVAFTSVHNADLSTLLQTRLNGTPTVVVFMSNGSFSGVPQSFVSRL